MRVLDKGYVNLIDKMGDVWTPVRAARVSFNKPLKGPQADKQLMRYMLKHGHTSPFEMVELVWEVKAPIFVARQWLRYRTANVNEFSQRYADVGEISEEEVDVYVPDTWREQSTTNRQGSGSPIVDRHMIINNEYMASINLAVRTYKDMIKQGVAREQARSVLPEGTYTKYIWKNDLHNTLHMIEQRTAPNAQWEIRQYAQAMLEVLREEYPLIIELWEEARA